jgi:hypothetical protein
MNLIRDVLDQQLIDCNDRKAGKVDGIALEIRDNEPPRVAYLDIGSEVRARRISRHLENLVRRLREHIHGAPSQPFQVPWSKVEKVHISVNLNVDATDYSDFRVENWLREHIIRKIPGNAHHKHQEKAD